MTMTTKTARIRELNDQLRENFSEGTAVMTCGVAALGAEAVARIVKTIAVYDDFCHANDPHEEHDFGAFEADGQRPRRSRHGVSTEPLAKVGPSPSMPIIQELRDDLSAARRACDQKQVPVVEGHELSVRNELC
jgi:hypothetical protein